MARSRECHGREFTQTQLSLTELGKPDLIHTKCLLNNNRKLDIHPLLELKGQEQEKRWRQLRRLKSCHTTKKVPTSSFLRSI
jgi:hypothetical protein